MRKVTNKFSKFFSHLFLFTFLFCSLSGAKIFAEEGHPKKAWIDAVSTALPTLFCEEKQFFRQCFKVSQEECEKGAASATRVCLNKYEKEMPEKFTRELGKKWGEKVGSCAGSTYEIALVEKKRSDKKCSDPKFWQ